jgi:glutamate N-acetyltransferase/amino-acid N-acetyltransferase
MAWRARSSLIRETRTPSPADAAARRWSARWKAAARAADCLEADVYVASTGVIGEPLDTTKFTGLLGDLAREAKPDAFEQAARAIMTTDTYPKLATRKTEIDGVEITVNGIAKGAGMIAPDMATDARLPVH